MRRQASNLARGVPTPAFFAPRSAARAELAAATQRTTRPGHTGLVLVDADTGHVSAHEVRELPSLLDARDLLVLNDAATLPASLRGTTDEGTFVEARLCGVPVDGARAAWKAVLFGAGDWRVRTEDRPPPPRLSVGACLRFVRRHDDETLEARVVSVDPVSPRLVELVFEAEEDAFWAALYRVGRPVQYAHLPAALHLWDVQTAFAARPWAAEAPSASFPLSFSLFGALRQRGLSWTTITHAAGLSSTGDAALDARLPFGERFEVGAAAVAAIRTARARGGRIVAVGTTVMRALESAADNPRGELCPAAGITHLRLGPDSPRRVTDALLTGLHEEGSSHVALLSSLVPANLWREAHAFAARRGLRGHEFGDVALLRARSAPR